MCYFNAYLPPFGTVWSVSTISPGLEEYIYPQEKESLTWDLIVEKLYWQGPYKPERTFIMVQ